MSYHVVKCLSQATSSSSFPDHLPFSYFFTHLVSVFLISFCPFFFLSIFSFQVVLAIPFQLFYPVPSLNFLDSWPHICFITVFPGISAEYTSENHWYPDNPFSHENICLDVRKGKRRIFGTKVIPVQDLGVLLPKH